MTNEDPEVIDNLRLAGIPHLPLVQLPTYYSDHELKRWFTILEQIRDYRRTRCWRPQFNGPREIKQ